MRWTTVLTKRRTIAPMLLAVLLLCARSAPCAVVSETEAIAVADLWYAMELNSGKLKMDDAERQAKLARIGAREVAYLVSGEDLLDHAPGDRVTLAYVVTYDPSGFVVVSGEDRLQPIVVFDVEGKFRWDEPELNFLRYFLSREMPKRWRVLEGGTHPVWSRLRALLGEGHGQATFRDGERDVYILWDTALWNQEAPYNELVVWFNGGISGIPTGCVATAMAIKMRFHSWPPFGNDSHSYWDEWGDVQFPHHVDYQNTVYAWQNMPPENLTSQNLDVAGLMYDSGVAVDMNYEVGASGANGLLVPAAMASYFRYKGTWTVDSDHETTMRLSIMGGLPVICRGGGHAVVVDGYRDAEAPFFHVNCGWGGAANGWYDLYSQFPGGDPPTMSHAFPYSSPDNFVYVDANYGGTILDGTMGHPYTTLLMGVAAVPSEGHLWIRGATYPAPVAFDKAMTIRSWEGTTVVGDNLSLSMAGVIRTEGAGELRIY